MNKYQPLVSPATASVVYCLEPLFGTLFSVAFRTEQLSQITLLGGSIILIAVIIVARSTPPAPSATSPSSQ
jgi:drug/metabolite transporter (DMT)-like permease